MRNIVDLQTKSGQARMNSGDEQSLRARRGKFRKIIIFFILLAFLGAGFAVFTTVKDRGTYQAVFLANDQVYFGHLSYWPFRSTATLSDIYYLRADKPLQPQGQNQDQLNMELVKFGKEAHGPEDKMVIPKNQILFWEDLRDDSRVTQTILEHKRQKK